MDKELENEIITMQTKSKEHLVREEMKSILNTLGLQQEKDFPHLYSLYRNGLKFGLQIEVPELTPELPRLYIIIDHDFLNNICSDESEEAKKAIDEEFILIEYVKMVAIEMMGTDELFRYFKVHSICHFHKFLEIDPITEERDRYIHLTIQLLPRQMTRNEILEEKEWMTQDGSYYQ